MLEIKDLSVRAGRFHLTGISLSVGRGGFHVIMGPTGSGKTLLLECIAGLRTPHTGTLLLEGKDLASLPVEKRQIGFLPQDLALFPHLTVRGNILYGLKTRGAKGNGAQHRVAELCEALSIVHLLDRDVATLSGGEKQRVALARALAPGCRLLLLDEPFTALHRGMRKDLWFLLKGLQEDLGVTVLMVTHDLEEALFLGDMLSVLIEGSIRQTGTKMEVFAQPNSVEVAQLMGVRNFFRGRVAEIRGEAIRVQCEALNSLLTCAKPARSLESLKQGSEVVLGIRGTDVTILNEDSSLSHSRNMISGTTTAVFENGQVTVLLFQPDGASRMVEIERPSSIQDHAPRSMPGQALTVSLTSEALLLFPKDRPLHLDTTPWRT